MEPQNEGTSESAEKRHIHHGKSSRNFIDPVKVLKTSGLEKGDAFLDAGCGDGYFSIAASAMVGARARVYAFDLHEESLSGLMAEIERRNIRNIEVLKADLTERIPLPPLSQRLDESEVYNAVKPFGFEKTLSFEAGEYHYAVLFVKVQQVKRYAELRALTKPG